MILHEIGIGNFRSIGNNPVWINLEKKINVYIGANNSGKSNVLRAFEWLVQNKSLEKKLSQIELHQRDEKNPLRILLKSSFEESDGIPEVAGNQFVLDFNVQGTQREWLDGPVIFNEPQDLKLFNKFGEKYTGRYFTSMPRKEEAQKKKDEIYRGMYNVLIQNFRPTFYIPQFRQITPGTDYSIKGQGIVEMLASWQHPEITADQNIGRFLKIQELLRRLLNLSNIEMEVVHTKDHVIVKNNNLRLPLESYGTGVHELIILAVAVYSQENVFFLIEEPEIHLHPKLQKEFLNFIIKETSNHYLISTHSNALIQPSNDVDVVHLKLTDDATTGRRVESSGTILEILTDLGISPSDILQANSVIWVEGPSDRIFINKWINLLFPELIEGINYSIMFYGGKLLSHLSLDRDAFPNPSDLIPLLRINQKSIIVIDSDRKKKGARISRTKSRVKSECEENNIYCWITDGKEIENYLSGQAVSRAYKEFTSIEVDLTIDAYDDLESLLKSSFGKRWKKSWSYNSSKPNFARKIIQHFNQVDITTDLKRHLNKIYCVITDY